MNIGHAGYLQALLLTTVLVHCAQLGRFNMSVPTLIIICFEGATKMVKYRLYIITITIGST